MTRREPIGVGSNGWPNPEPVMPAATMKTRFGMIFADSDEAPPECIDVFRIPQPHLSRYDVQSPRRPSEDSDRRAGALRANRARC